MLKKFNILLITFALIAMLPICACSSNKDEESGEFKKPIIAEEQANNNTMVLASTSEKTSDVEKEETLPAQVFTIKSVMNAVKGRAVDFTWNDGKKDVSFSQYTRGKAVFLNFWGTWCGPCRAEIPAIIDIVKDLKDRDFVVVGVALEHDPAAALNGVKQYVQKAGINYINVLDLKRELDAAYGRITGVPTSMFIDKNGNIKDVIVGSRPKAEFMKLIEKVLD
ncbi:MAG: TlpA family protein disulfide reductase [Ignavibacteria bacterium]|nr:TlpA family protein disulfide reductase [Ignavibacteria bacterium]